MTAKPALWISHAACQLHDMGDDHPECPARLAAIDSHLRASGLELFFEQVEAPQATLDALLRVHDADHVEAMLRPIPADSRLHIDQDTWMTGATAEAALRAAGAAQYAVEALLENETGFAFCAVRPPGHHAERARAMGFCFFNNIAVAAAHALSRGLSRIAILDFDVHYGNGTADIFGDDPRLLLCSTYQDPLFPYWKGRPEQRNLIDIALPPGTSGDDFRGSVDDLWFPALQRFRPQLLLVAAGFDALAVDEMAQLNLRPSDFNWLGERIHALSQQHCPGKVAATLEGGYRLDALGPAIEAFVRPFVDA